MIKKNYLQFFEELETKYRVLSAARIVSSFDEAYDIQYTQKESLKGKEDALAYYANENTRYNRFELVYMELRNQMINTIFEFSTYVNLIDNAIYLFLDDVGNNLLRLNNKPIPKLYKKFSMANFYKEVDDFLDNEFLPAIFEYYKDSKYDLTELDEESYFFASLCEEGDLKPYEYLKNITNIKEEKINYVPFRINLLNNINFEEEDYRENIINLMDISIMKNEQDGYVFLNDGNFIWGMKSSLYDNAHKELFNYFVELEA